MTAPVGLSHKAWVVTELYHPETTSTGYFLTHIAEGLAADREVGVICSQPTYSTRGTRAPTEEVRNGTRIHRCWSTTFDKDRLALRVVNHLTFTASVFTACLRRFSRGEIVLVVTNPPILPFAVVLAARLRGARPILLVHDVYPDVLVATGLARPDAPVVRLVAAANRWLYRRVERIVVLGRDMRRLAARRRDRNAAHDIELIPNWGDVSTIRPTPRAENRLRRRLGLEDRFVVQYLGNMGRTHGIDVLMDAAHRLRDDPSIHFLFAGDGARRAALEARVAATGAGNVTVLPPCSSEELGDCLNAADVGVIPFRRGMSGVSVPSRLYNVMAAGTPLLAVADDDSELAAVVREEDIGWVVAPDDVDALVETILVARDAASGRAEMGRRARAAAESRYSLRHVVAEYRRLFSELDAMPSA